MIIYVQLTTCYVGMDGQMDVWMDEQSDGRVIKEAHDAYK